MEPGDFASIIVNFVEDRDGRALIRLPNGSKTRVEHDDLNPLPGSGHMRRSATVGGGVVVACYECDWTGRFTGGHEALAALAKHEHAQPQI